MYADAGYDSEAARQALQGRDIIPHIRRRNTTHGSGLGKVPVKSQDRGGGTYHQLARRPWPIPNSLRPRSADHPRLEPPGTRCPLLSRADEKVSLNYSAAKRFFVSLLVLRGGLRKVERRFGDGYPNAVFVDLLDDSESCRVGEIADVRKYVKVNPPERDGRAAIIHVGTQLRQKSAYAP
ncbi:hypothetical protein Plim_1060 [Planctopirus limnophila DSM 3776]|uniref:Transposase IS4 family protein n=1 Tax=Planctopirus limnophila (strain ATCC 43296 / DSM 3776 / IFAM 1008 / Mu 290) TaxID=521674 RepID=D5STD2_PLAL2|nr:hypothetical protein [Planctopirus limnophila]ADG66900.1 hypothetical protein Plim_1060 [Planctopirus limnophila DSM 3776]